MSDSERCRCGPASDVNRDAVGTRLGEGGDVVVRPVEHQVDIEDRRRARTDRRDRDGAEADIRHEDAVHDIEVQPLRARRVHGGRLFSQTPEVTRQERRRDRNRLHRPGIPCCAQVARLEAGVERLQT